MSNFRTKTVIPPLEYVRSLLSYNEETGALTWLESRGKAKAGSRAGQIRKNGYRRITIDSVGFGAAHLAIYIKTGVYPILSVDHRNRNRSDDRWDNLWQASKTLQNINRGVSRNCSSGVTGVHQMRDGNWKLRLSRNRKVVYSAVFDTFSDAVLEKERLMQSGEIDFDLEFEKECVS